MKKLLVLILFEVVFYPAGISQVALVLKNLHTGREWPVNKGKKLMIISHEGKNYYGRSISTGSLSEITDSSLTLHKALSGNKETILFKNIDTVRVLQSKAGTATGYILFGLGALEFFVAPFSGITRYGLYDFTRAAAALYMGALLTGTGFLIINPFNDKYQVSGTCKTRNERFLKNKNGTYYFSIASGTGVSYGGIGFRFQSRFGRLTGIGFHVGAGWEFPFLTDSTERISVPGCFSVLTGVKFFPYRGWYIGAQFGNFGRIADISINENIITVNRIHTPYGFVFTVGGDWIFGRYFGLNLGAGTAIDLTAPESSNTFPVFDMGFIIKL